VETHHASGFRFSHPFAARAVKTQAKGDPYVRYLMRR
jgi:hypothetical protein